MVGIICVGKTRSCAKAGEAALARPPYSESCRAAAAPPMDGLVLRAVCPRTEREAGD